MSGLLVWDGCPWVVLVALAGTPIVALAGKGRTHMSVLVGRCWKPSVVLVGKARTSGVRLGIGTSGG